MEVIALVMMFDALGTSLPEAQVGATLGKHGLSWAPLGPNLESTWANLVPTWSRLGPT